MSPLPLTQTETALQGIALSGVQASEQLVDAVAKAGTQAAAATGTATDATTQTLLAIIDSAINIVNLSTSDAAAGQKTTEQDANCTKVLGIVAAVVIVVVACILAAVTFGAAGSLVALAVIAAAALIGGAASSGSLSASGQLIGAMIGTALVMLVTGGAVSTGSAEAAATAARRDALAKLIKAITLLESSVSQYRPLRLSAAESPETVDQIASILRRLVLLLRRHPSAPRIQMILPRLDALSQALAAAAARLRARIAVEQLPAPPGSTIPGIGQTSTTTRFVP